MPTDPRPRLRAWIIENLFDGTAPADFDDDTDLIADGRMDSLAIMGLLTHLETDHGTTVAPGDIVPEHFQSVGAIAGYLASASSTAAAPDDEALAERGRALAADMPHLLAYPSADYVLAPYLNSTLRPHMDTETIRADAYGFRVSHDARGIIDSESWPKRPRRALLLGNSFAMGWSCSGDDQTLASQLSRLTPYSFLNLGITGASSLQETIAAVPFLAQAELVVVISGVGNLLHYLEYGSEYDLYGAFFPQPLFLGVRQARIDTLTAALRQDTQTGESPTPARAELAAQVARFERIMGKTDGRRPRWSEAQVRERRDLAVQHQFRDLRLLKQALEPGTRILYAMQPTSTLAKPQLEPDEQAMLAAVRHVPMWRDVFEPYVRDQLPDYTAAIRANCAALDVPYLDLNAIDYPGICFVDYGHTTDLGNAQIAEHLARHLDADPTSQETDGPSP
jgi:acyl carrier protein